MSELGSLVFYIFIFSIAVILIQLGYHEKKGKWMIGIGLMLPILIATYRYSVGTDYFTYLNHFQRTSKLSISEYIEVNGISEIGNYLLCYLGNKLGGYNTYLGIIAALTLIPIYLFLKQDNFNINIGISIFIFLCTGFMTSFNIMMQMIAVSISTLSYKYIFRKDFFKFLLVILIASSFHSTALLLVPVYFLWVKYNEKDLNLFNKRTLILISIFLLFILNIEYLMSLLTSIEIFSDYSGYAWENNRGSNRDIILKFIVLVVVMILRKQLILQDKRNKLFIIFILLNFIIGLTGGFSPFIKRMGLYFEVSQIILFPTIIKLYKNSKERAIVGFLVLIYIVLLMTLTIYVLKQGHLIPYQYKIF